jgi:hypothetical protein
MAVATSTLRIATATGSASGTILEVTRGSKVESFAVSGNQTP